MSVMRASHFRARLFFVGALACATLQAAVTAAGGGLSTSTAAPITADQEWTALEEFLSAPLPAKLDEMPPTQRLLLLQWRMIARCAREMDFVENHPDDPRRWIVVHRMSDMSPFFKGWAANEKGELLPLPDEVAAAAWRFRVAALKEAMLTASDLPGSLRDVVKQEALLQASRKALVAVTREATTENLAAARALVEEFSVTVTDPRVAAHGGSLVMQYLACLEKKFSERLPMELAHFATSPLPSMADAAARRQTTFNILGRTIDLRFTAVDGRAVDLQQLRGKVVLIDFWATWCGPCVAELPNVIANYQKYHDSGFEVIGISLENGQLKPTDSAVQSAEKLAKARKVLMDFTAQRAMPWPQYFDGKYWKNDLVSRFGIDAIPAMFLLDQDGLLVSTNARGEKLEQEIRRLLKL